ncbi:DUF3435 domain containing protein [Pyrenophora tritici-repentis]|uniref:DUF3435 containing protein n=2 Tax=Pyrenophora tritici-repentis TaxID=45151 RepID=A0A2W1G2T7_9PLEO|nr:DUF3435 containing protein [Pyrenophora tritici-repentis]PZC90086.1 DUF3435 domain containing protein [Pyrenophora tritici-repentis]PZD31393.1 DUF3435 domain containing protein [Pyrenophora tritici-repentis]
MLPCWWDEEGCKYRQRLRETQEWHCAYSLPMGRRLLIVWHAHYPFRHRLSYFFSRTSSSRSPPTTMPSSTKRSIRRELATSTAVKNAALMRNRYSLRRSNPSPAAVSCWEGQSDTNSFSDTYSDPDTEADTDIEPSTSEDAGLILEQESDADLDSEAEEILKDIAQLRAEGPAKPNHTPHTVKLWKREGDFWERYCFKIMKKTKRSPEEQLRACDPEAFKAYLRWRKKHSWVKKESSMRSYWKRISMCYMDLTRHTMDADVLTDILTLMLDKSEKEKHAMYVQDLYAILHALWVDDTKPLHGYIRVQISLLLLLSAATATRPGAIVESASAKGSNKSLSFRNIELLKVRSTVDPSRSIIVANVNLENIKNKEKDRKPKKFTFRLEGTLAFCIVSYILSISVSQGALRDNFTSVQDIFDLNIPAGRDVLRVKWKKELLNQPFLCDVRNTSEGVRILPEQAFPYAKYRDIFVRLGRVAGFEKSLELYQLRWASRRNINSALDPVERNQTMGHLGSTYEKYYTPTHIARDFQSIYFGSPSEDLLIQSVARIGLSRDRRAPTELDDAQQEALRNDPALAVLREERETYKEQLHDQGFHPLSKGQGTDLYKKYEDSKRKISSTYQRLYRERLDAAYNEFHESIDTIEIARQLSGKAAAEVLTLPAVEFELRERATIAGMLFKPIQDDKTRVRFVRTLARLCHKQETRQPKAFKRKNVGLVTREANGSYLSNKRKKGTDSVENSLLNQDGEIAEEELDVPPRGNILQAQFRQLYPRVLPHPVCLICIGNEEFSYERRMRHVPRKDVLKKHVETHFRLPELQSGFQCRHPSCSVMLVDMMHFKRHALDVHGVSH